MPDVFPHGTENGYGNLGCRCDKCRAAHAAYFRDGAGAKAVRRYRDKRRQMKSSKPIAVHCFYGDRCVPDGHRSADRASLAQDFPGVTTLLGLVHAVLKEYRFEHSRDGGPRKYARVTEEEAVDLVYAAYAPVIKDPEWVAPSYIRNPLEVEASGGA